MHQISLQLGLSQRSPRPHSWNLWGPTSKEREGRRRGNNRKRKMKGRKAEKGRKGRKVKGREGKGDEAPRN